MNIKKLFLKLSNFQIVKYGLVGVISTIIHLSISFSYLYFIDKNVLLANIIAFSVAFIFSYTVQSIVVFKHKLQVSKVLKYFLVQFTSLLIAFFLSDVLVLKNSYIQTLVITFLLPIITFFTHKLWTFKETTNKENTYASK